jgi:hypothetical protein
MFANRPARRLLSPALLLLVLGCFFLPIATVSCDGARVSPTGIQLVVGQDPADELAGGDYGGDLGKDVVDATQLFAVVAFASVVLALGAALVLPAPSRLVFLLSELGFLGFIWIAVAGAITDATVEYRAGFWLPLLGLGSLLALHVSAMWRRGFWAALAVGIPGMLHPVVLLISASVSAVVYGLIRVVVAERRSRSSSHELLPPPTVQTTGKNDSSMEASPTRL